MTGLKHATVTVRFAFVTGARLRHDTPRARVNSTPCGTTVHWTLDCIPLGRALGYLQTTRLLHARFDIYAMGRDVFARTANKRRAIFFFAERLRDFYASCFCVALVCYYHRYRFPGRV